MLRICIDVQGKLLAKEHQYKIFENKQLRYLYEPRRFLLIDDIFGVDVIIDCSYCTKRNFEIL